MAFPTSTRERRAERGRLIADRHSTSPPSARSVLRDTEPVLDRSGRSEVVREYPGRWLQPGDAGAGAVFVFLRGAAADAAGADDDAVADDRQPALTHDHVPALGGGDAARGRVVGARGQLAARPAERGRGDRLALAAVDPGPDRIVHAAEGDQPAAGVADRDADLDVELARLGDGAGNDAVGFVERQTHAHPPVGG